VASSATASVVLVAMLVVLVAMLSAFAWMFAALI
jgi:hypothetical protein